MNEFVEGLLDIVSCFGGRFFEAEVVLNAEIYNLFFGDGPGLLSGLDQIKLISDYYFGHLVLDFLLDLFEPHAQVFETFPLGDVEHDDGSVTFAIVGSGDGHILFCSCCLLPLLHVSQMLTRTSFEPTLKFTGAYSTPIVGVKVFSLARFPIT